MAPLIAPSLLAADFANLQRDAEMLNQSDADWFHLDVMDGVFVPNISFGLPVINAIGKHAKKPLDVHLMITKPDDYIDAFKAVGTDIYTVHFEACTHLHRTAQAIRAAGMQAGVAINPHTSVQLLEDIITEVDLVCVMSVNPGFGGQKFIPATYGKIKQLRQLIKDKGASAKIEVDGGVDTGNAQQLVEAGADVLVAGSAVFASKNPTETIAALKACSSIEA